MSPFAIDLEKAKVENTLVKIEPALNGFQSMLLISKAEDEPGIHEWVTKTRWNMSREERFRHKLVTIGFHYAILPKRPDVTFETYLNDLEATPPSELRGWLLNAYSGICLTKESQKRMSTDVDWDEVLTSARNYVEFLRSRFGDELTDEEVETRAYEYVIDPAALKQLVTGHIRWFWKNYLQAEWTRVHPMLEESAKAFNQIDYSDMTRAEIIQFVTGKDLSMESKWESKWGDSFIKAKELIFVPNAHIGPYIRADKIQDTFYLYFGAHLPEGSETRIPELDRAEIVSRISALADDTRLQILQMIAEKGEMRSQEIMEAIGLSQPSVSRYLSQLTAAGYLQERRANGAKAYILNQDRIEKTLKAVSAFLLGRSQSV
ncbi:MAG TPA: metalloregulator ArsR/SmtB family transcription factor [Anaerolineales bacterium]|nr:metalloregulator ArsR/SmtB family transcription factor [Anaerolineales bacterium]